MRDGIKSGKSMRDKLSILKKWSTFCGRPKMAKVIYFYVDGWSTCVEKVTFKFNVENWLALNIFSCLLMLIYFSATLIPIGWFHCKNVQNLESGCLFYCVIHILRKRESIFIVHYTIILKWTNISSKLEKYLVQ